MIAPSKKGVEVTWTFLLVPRESVHIHSASPAPRSPGLHSPHELGHSEDVWDNH